MTHRVITGFPLPFRWDLYRRSTVETLLGGEVAESYPGFLDDLLPCCARILARRLGRTIVVGGACTGSDAHTAGIDAILNYKGFADETGLQSYKCSQSSTSVRIQLCLAQNCSRVRWQRTSSLSSRSLNPRLFAT